MRLTYFFSTWRAVAGALSPHNFIFPTKMLHPQSKFSPLELSLSVFSVYIKLTLRNSLIRFYQTGWKRRKPPNPAVPPWSVSAILLASLVGELLAVNGPIQLDSVPEVQKISILSLRLNRVITASLAITLYMADTALLTRDLILFGLVRCILHSIWHIKIIYKGD